MKFSTLLPLAVFTISQLPAAGAWEVTWHDSDNKSHSRTGHGPSDCIEIENPEGKVFNIDSKGEKGINMLLFDNDECNGKSAGSATETFSRKASRELLGFKVVKFEPSDSSESETTSADQSSSRTASSSNVSSTSTSPSTTTSSDKAESSTAQNTASTSAVATSGSATSSKASPTTSAPASATTSNAAIKMVGSSDNVAKGVMGGIMGIAMAQWMI